MSRTGVLLPVWALVTVGREQCGWSPGCGGLCWLQVPQTQPGVGLLQWAVGSGWLGPQPHPSPAGGSPQASVSSSVKWTQGRPCHSRLERHEMSTGEGCPKARPAVASGGWSPGDPDWSLGGCSGPQGTSSPPQATPSRLMKLERWFWPLTSDSKMRSQTSVCSTQSAQPSPRGHRAAPRGHSAATASLS